MIELITKFSVAEDSPDHLNPWGTKNDNNTSLGLILELEQYFNNKISLLDLGCAGGQWVIDFVNRNHTAVGLEGSDYSIKNNRKNWVDFYKKNLFTCDISKEFFLKQNGNLMLFECITAWEVLEHLKEEDLEVLLKNIDNHLKLDGIFVGTVSTKEDIINGVNLHQSVFEKDIWFNDILAKYFVVEEYPFMYTVREDVRTSPSNFHFLARKK